MSSLSSLTVGCEASDIPSNTVTRRTGWTIGESMNVEDGPRKYSKGATMFWNADSTCKELPGKDAQCDAPWFPNLNACSWNGHAAFPANFCRFTYKVRGLKKLLRQHDVVCIQESHLAMRS